MNFLRTILILIVVSVCLPGRAADRITATIAVTNAPLGNTNTLTINGNVRTFTNSVTASPGTLVQQTNSVPWSATNLINQLTDYRVSQFHFLGQSASNNVRITGTVGEALTVSLAGLWGTITYSTQNVTIANVVRVPMSVEFDTNRAWIASLLVTGLSDYSTNSIATNAVATSNYITKGASPIQNITSPLNVLGALRSILGLYATNGFTYALTNINPVLSNAVVFGGLRSEGSGGNSLQVGSNAVASGSQTLAVGNGALASGARSIAIGTGSISTNTDTLAIGYGARAATNDTVAIGNGALAYGSAGTAIGRGAEAALGAVSVGEEAIGSGVQSVTIGNAASAAYDRSVAIGYAATSLYSNSVALGQNSVTSSTNQVRLGTSLETVSIPGMLEVTGTITNIVSTGTNRIGGQLVFVPTSNTGLANGYNAGVAIGSTYVKFSGPSAAYTNAGFSAANKMDGRMHFCQFDNPGLSMTFLHDSGLDAGNSTNRIYTGTGALLNSTNRVVHVILSYDDSVTAWRIWSFR